MERTVQVELGSRSYPIRIGAGLLEDLGAACRTLAPPDAAALLVTDDRVASHWAATARGSLEAAGRRCATVVIPAGEASKCGARLTELYDAALAAGLDRRSFMVALGGGVVGDLTGYAAATYLRGIALVQVPTTLLAMVDSSVGGKTGINLPQGKNLVGAFHQPARVLADLATLATLPDREYRAGLAEVIKYGVIYDADFFARLERDIAALRARDETALLSAVARSCEIKAAVVGQDEREGGLRAILNFGHTLAHAIEQAAGYGTYLHGEAVAIGMHYAARLSCRTRGFPAADAERLAGWLRRVELPLTAKGLSWETVRAAMAVDKKSAARAPRWALADRLGAVAHGCAVLEPLLEEVWHGLDE